MQKNKYRLEDYPLRLEERLRYRDTDAQGHINNAVYVTLLEVGRVQLLRDPKHKLGHGKTMFMMAHISVDYLAELTWPNTVTIGTRVIHIGTTSFTTEQVIFVGDTCVAVGKTVIVTADRETRQKKPLSEETKAALKSIM